MAPHWNQEQAKVANRYTEQRNLNFGGWWNFTIIRFLGL